MVLDLLCLPTQHLGGGRTLLEELAQRVFVDAHVSDSLGRFSGVPARVHKHQHLVLARVLHHLGDDNDDNDNKKKKKKIIINNLNV